MQPDAALIERKLALYGMVWEPTTLQEALQRAHADWERDLRPLLPQFVSYQVVHAGTEALLAFGE